MLKTYRIARVTGDHYAGEWPREQFRKNGVSYDLSEKPKSAIYGDLLPLLNSGKVELLEHPRQYSQLVSLERRTGRIGKDTIDHPPKAHDDLANAACGALLLVADRRTMIDPGIVLADPRMQRLGVRADIHGRLARRMGGMMR